MGWRGDDPEIVASLSFIIAENRRLKARLNAVIALCGQARPSLSVPPRDCNNSCYDGPCECSGEMVPLAWRLDPAEVRAAATGDDSV